MAKRKEIKPGQLWQLKTVKEFTNTYVCIHNIHQYINEPTNYRIDFYFLSSPELIYNFSAQIFFNEYRRVV